MREINYKVNSMKKKQFVAYTYIKDIKDNEKETI